MRGERNAVANKMKGKLDASEWEALIEQGILHWLILMFVNVPM